MKIAPLLPMLVIILQATNFLVEGKPFGIVTKAAAGMPRIPRGGALLDETTAAKASLSLMGGHALYQVLAPRASLAAYSAAPQAGDDAGLIFVCRELGSCFLNVASIGLLQLIHGMPFMQAVGWSCMPCILVTIYNLLNDKQSEIGMPAANGYLVLLVNALTSTACIRNWDFAPLAIQLYGGLSAFSAAFLLLNPKAGLETWKINVPAKSAPLQQANFRVYGAVLAAHATACLAPSFMDGVTALEGAAYMLLTFAVTVVPGILDFRCLPGFDKAVEGMVGTVGLHLATAYFALK